MNKGRPPVVKLAVIETVSPAAEEDRGEGKNLAARRCIPADSNR
jgi:hypothetical protein